MNPKIAIIAPSELVIPSIPSTVEAALLAKMGDRGQIRECLIDGPLALDVALDEEAAVLKGLKSHVAGDADSCYFQILNPGIFFIRLIRSLPVLSPRLYWSVPGFR